MGRIGLPENKAIAAEVADKGIVLVKNTEDIFPISPEKYKRVLLVDVKGTEGGFGALIGAQGYGARTHLCSPAMAAAAAIAGKFVDVRDMPEVQA